VGERYASTRAATLALAEPLSPEDCQVQPAVFASPVKWHLAHTAWFFETFVLERSVPAYRPFHPAFRALYNSYYVGVGPMWQRPQRGLLTRPSLDDVRAYRAHVDRCMNELFERGGLDAATSARIELGLNHEEQHQELILTDVAYLLGSNPLAPAYREGAPAAASSAPALGWIAFEGGLTEIGHDGDGFSFDNERPRHRTYLAPFELASRAVTNGEWLAFVEDGGYARAELWMSDGWEAVRAQGWSAPLHWRGGPGERREFTLRGERALDLAAPASHVGWYEADAFARWRGARLPTEAEWETAAASVAVDGNFVESGALHPRAATAGPGLRQMFGDVWEWTSSDYAPYPGFRPDEGDIGEYNGKFMCNQRVLRGGSCATPRGHARATYRNFFQPDARWQFSGLRLARTLT
jgi:ergothioneine biosynthesis protein EgtB